MIPPTQNLIWLYTAIKREKCGETRKNNLVLLFLLVYLAVG